MSVPSKFPVTRRQPVDAEKVRLAEAMRRDMTPEERLLWNRLRRSALKGLHFHRQQIIAGFIVDFYCAAARIAIEVDGAVHDALIERDKQRDQALANLGISTIRIRNEDVATDFEEVLRRIAAACRPNP